MIYDIHPELYQELVARLEAQREESLSILKEQKSPSQVNACFLKQHVQSLADAESALSSLRKNFSSETG